MDLSNIPAALFASPRGERPEAVSPLAGRFGHKPGSKQDIQARAAERIAPIWRFLAAMHPFFQKVVDGMTQEHVEAMTPPPLPVEMRHMNQVRASMARKGAHGGGSVMAANALMQPPGSVGAGTSAMTPPPQFSSVPLSPSTARRPLRTRSKSSNALPPLSTAATPPPLPVEMRHMNQVRASMARKGAHGGGSVMAANALMQPPGSVGAGTSAMTPPPQFSSVPPDVLQVGAGIGPALAVALAVQSGTAEVGSSTPPIGDQAAPQATSGNQGWDAWPIFPLSNVRPGGAASVPSRAATPSPTPVAATGGNPVPFGGPASPASADAGGAAAGHSAHAGQVVAPQGELLAPTRSTATGAAAAQSPLSTASTPSAATQTPPAASQTPVEAVSGSTSVPAAVAPPNTNAIIDTAFLHWGRGDTLPGSETPGTLENRLQTAYNSGKFSSVGAITSEIESFHAEKATESQQNRPEALQIATAPPLLPGIATVGHETGPQAPAGSGTGVSAGSSGPVNAPQTPPVAQVPRGTLEKPALATMGRGNWPVASIAQMELRPNVGSGSGGYSSAPNPAAAGGGSPSIAAGGSTNPGQTSQLSGAGAARPSGSPSPNLAGSSIAPAFAQPASGSFASPITTTATAAFQHPTTEPPPRPVPNVLASPPLPHGSQPPAPPPAGAASGMGGGAFAFGTGAVSVPIAQRVPPDMNRAEMTMAGGGGAGTSGDNGEQARELREIRKILTDIKNALTTKNDSGQPASQWQASRSFGGKSSRKLPDKPAVKVSTVPSGNGLGALASLLGRWGR